MQAANNYTYQDESPDPNLWNRARAMFPYCDGVRGKMEKRGKERDDKKRGHSGGGKPGNFSKTETRDMDHRTRH